MSLGPLSPILRVPSSPSSSSSSSSPSSPSSPAEEKLLEIVNANAYETQPKLVRKIPMHRCRERHLAIRRKKSLPARDMMIKTCKSCKCLRESHAVYHEQLASVRERIGIKLIVPTHWESDPREFGYAWVPPGIRASSKIHRYFEQFPKSQVPKLGSEGERYREHQIICQLPRQDLSLEYCKHLEPEYRASYEDFVAGRNEIALDIGYVKDAPHDADCVRCLNPIDKGEMSVVAPKLDDTMTWHPTCFVCSTCEEPLVDLTYCVHEDKIYCERHYSEMLKPRCNGCDEVSDT